MESLFRSHLEVLLGAEVSCKGTSRCGIIEAEKCVSDVTRSHEESVLVVVLGYGVGVPRLYVLQVAPGVLHVISTATLLSTARAAVAEGHCH